MKDDGAIREAARQMAMLQDVAEDMVRRCVEAFRKAGPSASDRKRFAQISEKLRSLPAFKAVTYPTHPSAKQRPERRRPMVQEPRNRHPSMRRKKR